MDGANVIRIFAALLLATILVYIAMRIWRSKKSREAKDNGTGFHPRIGFTRLDGFQSVAVLLTNESDDYIWAEEIEIALTDLEANQQTSEPSCHEIKKIHQSVRPRDLLSVSLVEAIYNAAGRPQRKYSCAMSSVVRYRAGEKWFEEPMNTYKLKMAGLTISGIRRDRKTVYQFKPREKSEDLHATSTSPR